VGDLVITFNTREIDIMTLLGETGKKTIDFFYLPYEKTVRGNGTKVVAASAQLTFQVRRRFTIDIGVAGRGNGKKFEIAFKIRQLYLYFWPTTHKVYDLLDIQVTDHNNRLAKPCCPMKLMSGWSTIQPCFSPNKCFR
jgi:hypothetical protein